MKRISVILVLSLAAMAAMAQPLRTSQIITDSVSSTLLGEDVKVNVYLPQGYDASADRLYPVVYLLHGLSDTYSAWKEKGHMQEVVDELIASGAISKMVIFMPNAGGPDVSNQWNGYFNMPGRPYEDFFFGELVPALESRYRIRADKQHRAIMGLSMGGGGSTVYSQRHPDMFSSCYAMSPWLDQEEPSEDMPKDKLYLVSKAVHDHSANKFVENADAQTVAALKTVKWFFDCGDDDFLLDLSMDIYRQMRIKGIPAELRIRDGWHCWEYWHHSIRTALQFATWNFGDPENR
ncbi:MAG: esterase family protein [Bacteroidales bacterium]|nr:esterase family protein [Bacteroidales bacterium]